MRIFYHRPLALAGGVLALTACLCYRLNKVQRITLLGIAGLCLLLLVLFACLRRQWNGRSETALLCLLAVLAATLTSHGYFDGYLSRVKETMAEKCRVTATVLSREDSSSYRGRFRIGISEINGQRTHAKAVLECTYACSLQPGDRFETVVAVLSEEDLKTEWSTYDLADGYLFHLKSESADTLSIAKERSLVPAVLFSQLNQSLSGILRERIDGEAGALSASLLLGARETLSRDTVLQFRRTGISHILALSGLHVSVLVGALELLLRVLRMPKRARAVLLPMAAMGYLLLVGVTPSATRAVLLVCVLYLGFLLGESYDPFTALCTVLALMLLVTPYAVLDLSLWMSFLSAGAILVFLPALTERWQIRGRLQQPRLFVRLWRAAVTSIAVGLAANLALLYLLASVFGELSVLSIPATWLLAVPTEVFLVLSALSLMFPGTLLHQVTAAVGNLLLFAAEKGASLSGVLIPANGRAVRVLLLLSTVLLCVFAVIRLHCRGWLLLPLALAVLAFLIPPLQNALPQKEGMEVTYLHTAHGQTLLLSCGGEAVAIDASEGTRENATALTEALRAKGCTELSSLLLVNPEHRDASFLFDLSTDVRLRHLQLPPTGTPREEAIAQRIAEEAEQHGTTVLAWKSATALSELTVNESYVEYDEEGIPIGVFLSFACEEIRFSYAEGELSSARMPKQIAECWFLTEVLFLGDVSEKSLNAWVPELSSVREVFLSTEEEPEALQWLPARARVHRGMTQYSFFPKQLHFE